MSRNIINTQGRICWPIVLAMLALMGIGILAIGVAEMADGSLGGHVRKQQIFATLGIIAFVVAALIDYRKLGAASGALAIITLGLLVFVFFLPPIRGSNRWIPLAGGFMFQPSEMAKLVYIIVLAWYLRYRKDYRRLSGLMAPFLITFIPLALILKEPDLGTSLLLLPTLLVMLFAAGARLLHIGVIIAMGLAIIFLPAWHGRDISEVASADSGYVAGKLGPMKFYSVDESLPIKKQPVAPIAYFSVSFGSKAEKVYDIQPLSVWILQWKSGSAHQIKRIEGWLRQGDPRIRTNIGMQQHISMLVLGSGGFAGQNAWKTTATGFRMLPDDHTDFIFSVIGGQWGFVGCVGTLCLYAIIFVFGCDIATTTRDPFGRLLAIGLLALLAAQLFINIGMTIGLMPITGMTLPLISYGGSSMLINCAALGLLVNIGRTNPPSLAPEPFSYR